MCNTCDDLLKDGYRMGYSDAESKRTDYRIKELTAVHRQAKRFTKAAGDALRSQAVYTHGGQLHCTNCGAVADPRAGKHCGECGALLFPNGSDPPYAAVSNNSDSDTTVHEEPGGRQPAGTRDIAAMSWSWVPQGYLGFAMNEEL